MSKQIATFCADVVKYRGRLKDHHFNDIGLKQHIKTNGKWSPLNLNPANPPTEFWINPHKIGVLYNGNESFCCSKVPDHIATGVEIDGESVKQSVVDALNINPLNSQYEPVLEVWGIGEVGGDDCIYGGLSDDRKAKLREFYPETITIQDEDGNDIEITRGLIPEVCV